MLILQGVKIEGLRSLHSYFHFEQIYKLLRSEDAYLFHNFGRECLVSTSFKNNTIPRVKTVLFGTNGLDGTYNKNTGALRLVNAPELCLQETIPVDPKYTPEVFTVCDADSVASKKMVVLKDYNTFCVYILSLFQDTHTKLELTDPAWEIMRKSVQETLAAVTEKGKRRFPLEAATEMYLYFLLHALAGVMPDDRQSISALKADLDQLCPASVVAQHFGSKLTLLSDDQGNSDCPLPYYDGSQNHGEPLSVVEFTNTQKYPVTVTVKNTVLSRVVPAEKSVYALRKDGHLVCFFPRFHMEGKIATYVWEGNLYNEYDGIREQIDTEFVSPVSWARSNEYGTLIVDKTGKLDESAAWLENSPEKPVVMVDTSALDYCMLFSDGTVGGRIRRNNWKNMISIAIGLNSAAAIDSARQVVLSDGKRIQDFQAAEVRTHGAHYICMDAQGRILTDTDLKLEEPVYGIAVGRNGFAVALRNSIKLFDFTNRIRMSWNVSHASEIEVDDGMMVYYDAKSGEVVITTF